MVKRWYAQPLMDRIHSGVWWLRCIVSWILLCFCCQAWFMNLDSFGNVAKMGWMESESRSAKMNLDESWIVVRVGSYMSGEQDHLYYYIQYHVSWTTLEIWLLGFHYNIWMVTFTLTILDELIPVGRLELNPINKLDKLSGYCSSTQPGTTGSFSLMDVDLPEDEDKSKLQQGVGFLGYSSLSQANCWELSTFI